jgi:ribosome-associated heat shock protein Hsp15|tara:strand:+ start:1992 stop:2378 length:387 start_codon:yes stop_codon:yes gene_type:complete
MGKVRLDKWLWAARFFRTRAKAKQAIDGGKVHIHGVRGKASKEIRLGDELKIRQGWDEKTVLVTALSEHRGRAQDAALLYTETEQSVNQREQAALNRKTQAVLQDYPEGKPSKRDRRSLHKFRAKNRL